MIFRKGWQGRVATSGHLRERIALLVALAVVVALSAQGPLATHAAAAGGGAPTKAGVSNKPNIVLILTDDQRFDQLSNMPIVQQQLVSQGVSFKGFVVNSNCCPSRTTILTGKYSHGTDVYQDVPPHGGFATFKPEESSTIATWLQGAGYRTGLFGKYLNGYDATQVSHVPPGWNTWSALTLGGADDGNGYYNYTLSVDGAAVPYGSAPTDYSTDVLSQRATDFIASVPASQPLFLDFAPYGPHAPATPPPRYAKACNGIPPIRRGNYNEADVSDKPHYVAKKPLLSPSDMARFDRRNVRDCQTLLAVDDAVGNITDALQASGRLGNTMIVFMSDNGYLLGEHRRSGKIVPYEESIRVPIVVRYDPLTSSIAGSTNDDMVLNLDMAPTFADLAGVAAPDAEGMSFLPLLANPNAPWRSDFLIEHWGVGNVPAYCAVRTVDWKYVEYKKQGKELYDLANDPYELNNLDKKPAYAGQEQSMHDRLVELCNPPPPGFTP